MDKKMAKKIHLTAEQYRQNEVDWLSQHVEAWEWMCVYWASDEFKDLSNRNRHNRSSKPVLHNFGADGHTGKATHMVCLFAQSICLLNKLYIF